MLFTTRVCYQHAPDLQEEAHLMFMRYYIAPDQQLSKEQREQDLTLCHLDWEQSASRGSSSTPMPVQSVVELDVVRKRVCISPHFSCWQAGDRNHFLLNDLIDWWPPEELLPLTVVCKPARGTVAVLNDTDDGSDDQDVIQGPTAV